MNINGISLGYYSQKYSKKSNQRNRDSFSRTSQLSFGALVIKNGSRVSSTLGFRAPELSKEATKQFWEKMQVRLCNFPLKAKRVEPGFFTVGDEKFAYTIEKNSNDITRLIVKNRTETVEQWNKSDTERTSIDCSFDKNGMMFRAEIIHPVKKDFSTGIFYYHQGRNGNRNLRINDVTYMPTNGKSNIWTVIKHLSTRNVSGDADMDVVLKDVLLSDLFLQLMMNKTSAFIQEKR